MIRILLPNYSINSELFCKQRNSCVSLLRKYEKLNMKQITDKRHFWKTVNSVLSMKVQSADIINLAEENDSLIPNFEDAQKSFFLCIVKKLDIPNYEDNDYLSENVDYPTLKGS